MLDCIRKALPWRGKVWKRGGGGAVMGGIAEVGMAGPRIASRWASWPTPVLHGRGVSQRVLGMSEHGRIYLIGLAACDVYTAVQIHWGFSLFSAETFCH